MYKQAEYDCKNAHDRADKQKCQAFLELFIHALPPNYMALMMDRPSIIGSIGVSEL